MDCCCLLLFFFDYCALIVVRCDVCFVLCVTNSSLCVVCCVLCVVCGLLSWYFVFGVFWCLVRVVCRFVMFVDCYVLRWVRSVVTFVH